MLGCAADNGEMQEEQRNGEDYMDNRNFPELHCEARKHAEDQAEEKPVQSGCSESPLWDPQESDCLPSIFLAAFLVLLFVSVSVLLLRHETVRFPLRDHKSLSPNRVRLPQEDFQSLRLLFPNQPESTWTTFRRYVSNSLGKCHLERPWILVGIGPRDASKTLLCFTKAMLSLQAQQKSIEVRLLDPTSAWLPLMGSFENRTWAITSAKVLVGRRSLPSGLVVSLQSALSGKGEVTKTTFALVLKGVEQIQEKVLLQRLTSLLVSGILSRIHLNTDRGLNKVMTDNGNFPVLFIKSEQFLEDRWLCLLKKAYVTSHPSGERCFLSALGQVD
ncbi:uncharacterized protein LOC134506302 [Candoia aspera]|uniref:uncharacterized protein LOC134506302 n=1 Tax=Candoia aspera TaxID=51853 RepID=UPI002FD855A5